MSLSLRCLSCVLPLVLVLANCTVYDVDTASDRTFSGSVNRAVNKDRGRYVPERDRNNTSAPIYVDYSKSNPLLRHDDEFDQSKRYDARDPFTEQIDFTQYEIMKRKQQERREMQQQHRVNDKEERGMSLW